MKFQDYKYERPVVEEINKEAAQLFSAMKNATSKEDFLLHMDKFIQLRLHVESMFQLVSIRHSIDTRDEFYDKESDYVDMAMPELQNLVTRFYHIILNSPFRADIEKKYGK